MSGIYAMRCLRLSRFPGRLWSCQNLKKSLNCTCIATIWESEGLKARTDGQLAGKVVDLVKYKECTSCTDKLTATHLCITTGEHLVRRLNSRASGPWRSLPSHASKSTGQLASV